MCNSIVLKSVLDNNYTICPHCGNYLRIHARKRIAMIADKDTFREWNSRVKNRWDSKNEHIEKENYEVKVSQNNIDDAVITGEVTIDGYITAIGIMDTRFMMASMGYVVGEKITRLFEKATAKKIPVILFCCSGGACIQEGIISLMQMGKTAIAVKKHSQKGLLYISILTNPTMGGVTASFATIADVILAEKNATIGFAGARVVEQNIGIVLPKESQTAESKLQHGLVDKIVERKELKKVLSDLLGLHYKENIELKSKGIKAGVICNIQGDNNTKENALVLVNTDAIINKKIITVNVNNYITREILRRGNPDIIFSVNKVNQEDLSNLGIVNDEAQCNMSRDINYNICFLYDEQVERIIGHIYCNQASTKNISLPSTLKHHYISILVSPSIRGFDVIDSYLLKNGFYPICYIPYINDYYGELEYQYLPYGIREILSDIKVSGEGQTFIHEISNNIMETTV